MSACSVLLARRIAAELRKQVAIAPASGQPRSEFGRPGAEKSAPAKRSAARRGGLPRPSESTLPGLGGIGAGQGTVASIRSQLAENSAKTVGSSTRMSCSSLFRRALPV